MSMTKEVLEILIGKYLDGEIVPSEQRILEAELERDAQAKELFGQLRDLHQGSREAVASEILDRGKAAEEIFEQAWQQQSKRPLRPMMKMGGYMRFAAGLVAGFVIGLSLHFVLPAGTKPTNDSVPPDALVQSADNQMNLERPAFPRFLTDPADNVIRNVDWYNFTDEQGNQWLVEGLRENTVRPAIYEGDL
jgi:anti-sigma factor RsiW